MNKVSRVFHRIESQRQDVLGKKLITVMLPFCQHEWCISEAINRNSFENLSGVPQHLGPSVSVLPMIVIVELDIFRVHWDMIGANPNNIVGVGILVCSLPQNCAFLKHSVAFDWFWHCYVLLLNSFCLNRFLHDFFASLLCRSSHFPWRH